MIDEPVPTMPLMVPATSPTARTKRKFNRRVSCEFEPRCLWAWLEMQSTQRASADGGHGPPRAIGGMKTAALRILWFAEAIPGGPSKAPVVCPAEMREV